MIRRWLCRRGWHRWGYHLAKDFDVCGACGAEWPREWSYR